MGAHHSVLITFGRYTALVGAYVSMDSIIVMLLALVVKLFHGHHFVARVAWHIAANGVPDKKTRIAIVVFVKKVLGTIVWRW